MLEEIAQPDNKRGLASSAGSDVSDTDDRDIYLSALEKAFRIEKITKVNRGSVKYGRD